MTKQEEFENACEDGWKPESMKDSCCSCHINPPCSYCVIDDTYFEEWLEENNKSVLNTQKGNDES